MFSLNISIVYIIVSCAEKEGRLDLKGSTGSKIIKTVYNSPQSSTRGLVPELSEMFMKNTNILQEWLGKILCCQHKM